MNSDLKEHLEATVGKYLWVAKTHLEDGQADFEKLQLQSCRSLECLMQGMLPKVAKQLSELHTVAQSAEWSTVNGLKSVYAVYCNLTRQPVKRYF